jgi:hypothetical protein
MKISHITSKQFLLHMHIYDLLSLVIGQIPQMLSEGNIEKTYNYVRATKRTRKRKDKAASDFFSMA